jgi:hypothetical protein
LPTKLKVLLLSRVDLGGVNQKIARALARYAGDIEVEHVTTKKHGRLAYKTSKILSFEKKPELIAPFVEWADLVHIQEFIGLAKSVSHPWIVYHPVGSEYFNQWKTINPWIDQNTVGALVSGVPAYDLGQGRFEFIPVPLKQYKTRTQFGLPLRCCHAPTHPSRFNVKGTKMVMKVFRERFHGTNLAELIMACNVSNERCLEIKATCNVMIDQPGQWGYGMNSVEAWSFGMPVITGYTRSHLGQRWPEVARQLYGYVPFLDVSAQAEKDQENQLEEAVNVLASESGWNLWAECGKQHFQTWHEEHKVARRLRDYYWKVYDAL